MPMERSNNVTHNVITEEQFAEYREKAGYDKGWHTALDWDHVERERFRASEDYAGSDLQKEDLEKAEKKEKIMACFKRYDVDGDDHLSIREFGRIFVDCGWSRNQCDDLFKAVDTNKDKNISIKEFVKWLFKDSNVGKHQSEDSIREHANRATKAEDAVKEFFKYIKWLDESNDERASDKKDKLFGGSFDVDAFFDKMDHNKNGSISMQEFVTALESIGHKIDKKMMQKIYGLVDQAEANKKNLVNEKGEILHMKDGSMNREEWKKAWEEHMK